MLDGPRGELLKKSWNDIVFTSGDIDAPVKEYTPHPLITKKIKRLLMILFKTIIFDFSV